MRGIENKNGSRKPDPLPPPHPTSIHADLSSKSCLHSNSAHLARHALVHSGFRRYKCTYPGCTGAFFRADGLSQHKKTHLRTNRANAAAYPQPPHPQHQQCCTTDTAFRNFPMVAIIPPTSTVRILSPQSPPSFLGSSVYFSPSRSPPSEPAIFRSCSYVEPFSTTLPNTAMHGSLLPLSPLRSPLQLPSMCRDQHQVYHAARVLDQLNCNDLRQDLAPLLPRLLPPSAGHFDGKSSSGVAPMTFGHENADCGQEPARKKTCISFLVD
ncbi:hypothetical protein BJ741DRAFT_608794 [Chytriomyces cf. hyalinus JEL632]|nr:hypothetical protein BJ741DRAFT_608794 [Chytriomyces cf. hyalinus JEL632]